MTEDGFSLVKSRIAILGLGLMGGSLALALRGKCAALYGIDPRPESLELARRQSIVDQVDSDPAKLLPSADLTILAAPVPAILALLARLPELMPGPCILLDLGSTKALIVEAMARLPERFDPLGGHPICGKEKLGLANAERTLYYAASFVLTPLPRSSPRALSAARQVVQAVGARAIFLEAAEHDRILAATSHLPYLLSCALSLATPLDTAALIGPGYRSTGRLASTPASMMLGVMQTNRANILAAIHRLGASLNEIEFALNADNFSALEQILEKSHARHAALTDQPDGM